MKFALKLYVRINNRVSILYTDTKKILPEKKYNRNLK